MRGLPGLKTVTFLAQLQQKAAVSKVTENARGAKSGTTEDDLRAKSVGVTRDDVRPAGGVVTLPLIR